MQLGVFLLWLMGQVSPVTVSVSDLRQMIGPLDSNCVSITIIEQSAIPDAKFLEIDTGCSGSMNPTPHYRPFRMAIDNRGIRYKIFNFDSTQFNLLVQNKQLHLAAEDVYAYGEFFLDVTYIYDPYGSYFIQGADQLRELNKPDTVDCQSPEDYTKRVHRVETDVDRLRRRLDFDTMKYIMSTGTYRLDYFVWRLLTGQLRRITVKVHSSGVAEVVSDKVVAEKLGYYDPLIR